MLFSCTFIVSAQNSNEVSNKGKWYKPSYVNLQYAGQIGFLSVGVGKSYLNNKLETAILFGHLPKSHGGDNTNILSLKQSYTPFEISLKQNKVKLHLITLGAFASYYMGEEYNKYKTNQYPDNYYGFMKGYRLGAFISSDINLKLNPKANTIFSSLSLYYELGVNDLDFDRYLRNRDHMNLYEIANLALGMKLYF